MKNKGKRAKKYGLLKKLKGMSLTELLVSLLIFSIVMATISAIFARSMQNYKDVRFVQRTLESAQVAISLITKNLRSSEIIANNTAEIRLLDYALDRCILYKFKKDNNNNKLKVAYVLPTASTIEGKKTECEEHNFVEGDFNEIVSGVIEGSFYVEETNNNDDVGRVTTSIKACPAVGCDVKPALEAKIQSTASLRNY